MKKAILLLSLWSLPLIAQTELNAFQERARDTYLETDKNYSLDCMYGSNQRFQIINPVSETKRTSTTL
ncbi:MAG TPA: hypothetical protein VKZ84_00150 [Bacteriovoracaceae bacterium]|nr:hypothetical protein [Bacteriovoracaceae bacterium]